MEALAQAEADLAQHHANEDRVRTAAAAAESTATTATTASEAELAERLSTRDSLRAQLDAVALVRYDTMRGTHDGVAVAKLSGLRCEGCHLDMSRAEADAIKALPPDELGECPNCGRLLVR
jgi:predicted  nucleic acid-binding Zn-ribbon protein